jgi:DNA polymerase-3 subunit epsilon
VTAKSTGSGAALRIESGVRETGSASQPKLTRPAPAGKPAADLSAGRKLGVDGFVAIDFETATASRASACAVALAIVTAGDVTDVRRWLIRPPDNKYDGFNISLHGITPDMTADSRAMVEVWPEVVDVVGDRPLVAHYAAFDISVLRAALATEGGAWPDLVYYCTRALSRRAWPGLPSYGLVDIAAECGITFAHHDPGADAAVAAELAIACCGAASTRDLADASRILRVRAGRLSGD